MKRNKKGSQIKTLKKVLRYISRYRLWLVTTLVMAVIVVALTLYVPILVGRAIDNIIAPGEVAFDNIIRILLTVGISVGITSVAQWIMNMINNKIACEVVRDMREDAFRKVQSLPFSYLDSHPAGETVSRIITDVDVLSEGLLLGFTQLFTGVLTIIGTLLFMVYINFWITLVVVVMTPLSLVAASFIAKRTYMMFREQSETRAEQTALINEAINGQKTVQAFGQEENILSEFDEINGRLEKSSLKATFFSSLTNPVTRFVNALVYAAVALAGALSAVSGRITVGGLSCFLSYANQYTKPFNEISGVVAELQNALACAERILDLIEEEPEIPDRENAASEVPGGDIEFCGVSFSYTADKPLITDCSFTVKPGQRVAIVGKTGCGKTTLINLLMRFYDVGGGEIRMGGMDIRNMTRKALRDHVGMVLQETWLKSGTVRENLLMAKPEATDEEMISAAKEAHAHGFISRLPKGYDTVIGSASLSEGQRQLLCITRLMLAPPPVLILDEATSSIDTRTEVKIQSAFARLMEGRTSFIVAHRLSTIQNADLILVMDKGSIIEKGTHSELIRKGGVYAKLSASMGS
ncbi:MAG: ABC transporter ATP-binding protein [Oscillospiraceae bacterium]|nr:ABC transporter ATP-binding protein [Oscillospiraceae bacterium]